MDTWPFTSLTRTTTPGYETFALGIHVLQSVCWIGHRSARPERGAHEHDSGVPREREPQLGGDGGCVIAGADAEEDRIRTAAGRHGRAQVRDCLVHEGRARRRGVRHRLALPRAPRSGRVTGAAARHREDEQEALAGMRESLAGHAASVRRFRTISPSSFAACPTRQWPLPPPHVRFLKRGVAQGGTDRTLAQRGG